MAEPLHPAFQVCSNCYFYVNGQNRPGSCRLQIPDPPGTWPTVVPDDWCGQWASADKAKLRTAEWGSAETDADGYAFFVFPGEFAAPPHVIATVESDRSRPDIPNVTEVTTTRATVRVWHGQRLPADTTPSSVLENFDVFDGPGLGGIKVNFLALPAEG